MQPVFSKNDVIYIFLKKTPEVGSFYLNMLNFFGLEGLHMTQHSQQQHQQHQQHQHKYRFQIQT